MRRLSVWLSGSLFISALLSGADAADRGVLIPVPDLPPDVAVTQGIERPLSPGEAGLEVKLYIARRSEDGSENFILSNLNTPVCNGDKVKFVVDPTVAAYVRVIAHDENNGALGPWTHIFPSDGVSDNYLTPIQGEKPIGNFPIKPMSSGTSGIEHFLFFLSASRFDVDVETQISDMTGGQIPATQTGGGGRSIPVTQYPMTGSAVVVPIQQTIAIHVPLIHAEHCDGAR